MTTTTIFIITAVVLMSGAWAAWWWCKRREESTDVENPHDAWTPPGQTADTEPEKPMEPVNGDPAVLQPEPEPANEHQDQPEQPATQEPEDDEPTDQEPTGHDDDKDEDYDGAWNELITLFSQIVPIEGKADTLNYLRHHYDIAYDYFKGTSKHEIIYSTANFPVIADYFGEARFQHTFDVMAAWLFAMILTELRPDKRNELYRAAWKNHNDGTPLYGWTFETDPTIARLVAAQIYATYHVDIIIDILRQELGGKELTYKSDISELFIDLSYMPPAPGPYLKAYEQRPTGYPSGALDPDHNYDVDAKIAGVVANDYNLRGNYRQDTIQAISNKDHHNEHLFGRNRTVTDPDYGTMTFTSVFGADSIGVEIPDNGAIARLAKAVGQPSTDNRKSLLNREYGRRRPGQGTFDPSARGYESLKALVNYAIEEGDGHSTGYYNQGGNYVDGQGHHIGDYEDYYQAQLYANSYPSGHSAYIEAISLALSMVMEGKASLLMTAAADFANSRIMCRYHWLSDTLIGRTVGTMMLPVLWACTNVNMPKLIAEAREEFSKLKIEVCD